MYQGEKVDVTSRAMHYRPEDFPAGGKVVGLGCAEGYDEIFIAKTFPVAGVLGFDIDHEAIQKAQDDAWDAGVAEKTLFCCMDAKNLLVQPPSLITSSIDVLLILSVARWIGPRNLALLVDIFTPTVIYYETHSENDLWTKDFWSTPQVSKYYLPPVEIGRLPYTKEDPRKIRILYSLKRMGRE